MRRLILVLAFMCSSVARADYFVDAVEVSRKGDHAKAIELLRPLATKGDVKAQSYLGTMYRRGQGVAQDSKEAERLIRMAAEQGYAPAQHKLGRMYANCVGGTQDHEEAAKWYRKAADQGDASSQFSLGLMYHRGEGVAQDSKEAEKLIRMAAEQGFEFSKDWKMFEMMNRASEKYNYRNSSRGFSRNICRMKFAAEQGDEDEQFLLGRMYSGDHGVTKITLHKGAAQDYKEAAKWYRLAAEQGHADAQYNLGVMYINGQSVAQDNKEAVEWIHIAAEQGNERARNCLKKKYKNCD